MRWERLEFERLYAEPSKNGLTRPARVRGVGYKMINMGELFAHDRISDIPMERVPLNERELDLMMVESGDLLFARQSLVLAGAGKCSLVNGVTEPTTFESHIIRVRLRRESANPAFYFYYFKSPTCGIRSIVTQGVQAGIRGSDLKRLLVHVPSVDEQERIASILSAYDDLIENNRRRIQLLEESARLLYKEWFVHLRFPGHEHTRIFNGVPEGWERKYVPDVIDINPTERVPKAAPVRYVPMASLSTTGMTVDLADSEVRDTSTSVRFRNGDTLFARITPCLENGKTGFVNFLDSDEVACGSTEFIVLRGRHVSPYFTYCLARTHEFRETAIKSMIGSSGRQRVQASCFDEFVLPHPKPLLLAEFDDIVSPIFDQVSALMRQCERLVKARDLLLPRLMNGELSV